ncbi:MAG: hypothetical protein CMJ49_12865 [Planctomycetaceae bacterium]|nr:hypothetical protein [Planctomycetaceae bacterium]
MSDQSPIERRHNPRINVECSAKVFNPLNRRYRSARVRNLSGSGALIEVATGDLLTRGDRIELYVDPTSSAGVVDHDEMRPAVLIHMHRAGDRITAGVHFETVRAVAQAA